MDGDPFRGDRVRVASEPADPTNVAVEERVGSFFSVGPR